MKSIRLDVPHKTQTEAFDCSIASIQMILTYHNDPITLEEIKQNSFVKKWINPNCEKTHVQGLLFFLLDRGYKVTFYHHDTNVIDSSIEGISDPIVLQNKADELVKTQPKSYQVTKLMLDIQFIQMGGIYNNTLPTLTLLDNTLERQIPVRIGVQNNIFYGEPNKKGAHSVVVIGKSDNDYIILDPSPNQKAEQMISSERLQKAWYANGAYTVIVETETVI